MDLSRLDPHGPPNLDLKKAKLKQMIECRSCHLGKKDDKFSWLLKKDPYKLCVSCHNQYPHSGLVEHLGKKFKIKGNKKKETITCLVCHRPHRAVLKTALNQDKKQSKSSLVPQPSFLYLKRKQDGLPVDLIQKRNLLPILKIGCVDCHSWKSLP